MMRLSTCSEAKKKIGKGMDGCKFKWKNKKEEKRRRILGGCINFKKNESISQDSWSGTYTKSQEGKLEK